MSYLPSQANIVLLGSIAIGTSGSPADLGSLAVPNLPRWKPGRMWVVAKTAAGTLAASVLVLRTAAAGGGTALTAALTTTALTAADKFQDFTAAALTDIQTAASVFVRQTTNSANAGVADVYVELLPA